MQALAITVLPLLAPLGYWLGLAITIIWSFLARHERQRRSFFRKPMGRGDGLLLALLLGVGIVEVVAGAWHSSLERALPLAGAAWLAPFHHVLQHGGWV